MRKKMKTVKIEKITYTDDGLKITERTTYRTSIINDRIIKTTSETARLEKQHRALKAEQQKTEAELKKRWENLFSPCFKPFNPF